MLIKILNNVDSIICVLGNLVNNKTINTYENVIVGLREAEQICKSTENKAIERSGHFLASPTFEAITKIMRRIQEFEHLIKTEKGRK